MRAAIFCLVLAAVSAHAETAVRVSGFSAVPTAWRAWAPRQEIAPRTFLEEVRYRTKAASLAVSGNSDPGAFGGWECTVPGVQPGRWYRFTAWYHAEGLTAESLQVVARLDWSRAGGRRAGQPDYV